MTTQKNPAWLEQVQVVKSEAIQAAEAALEAAKTPAERSAAETQLLAAMLSATADEMK